MHDEGIIHGDVKGVSFQIPQLALYVRLTHPKANVMIDNECHARLIDFGLASAILDEEAFSSTANISVGSVQWTSPERLNPAKSDFRHGFTKESDCYVLGMTICDVLSGHVPFYQLSEGYVMVEIMEGKRPERLKAWFTDEVWGVLERCWKHKPSEQIDVKSVLSFLETSSRLRSDANDQSDATSVNDLSMSLVPSGVSG